MNVIKIKDSSCSREPMRSEEEIYEEREKKKIFLRRKKKEFLPVFLMRVKILRMRRRRIQLNSWNGGGQLVDWFHHKHIHSFFPSLYPFPHLSFFSHLLFFSHLSFLSHLSLTISCSSSFRFFFFLILIGYWSSKRMA